MAVSEDIIDLVRVLNEADLAWLAGEILTEIEDGRLSEPSPNFEKPMNDIPPLQRGIAEYEDEKGIHRKFEFIIDREDADPDFERIPIPENEQLSFAVEIVERRLLEPLRRFAEAERIAGELAVLPEPPEEPDDEDDTPPVEETSRFFEEQEASEGKGNEVRVEGGAPTALRIGFTTLNEGKRQVPYRDATPGSDTGADQVQAVLDSLRNLRS